MHGAALCSVYADLIRRTTPPSNSDANQGARNEVVARNS
jgi:hypothetical protein